jgi:hypothetical protein
MKVNSLKSREAGQSILLMALALGLFLLGAVAFAVDLGNLWWHRQRAQSAADAACIAGAMDLLVYNQTPAPTQAQKDALGGNPGTSFTCTTNSKASACEYAALNGYNSVGVTAGNPGNLVSVSFPKSLANAVTPTKVLPNPTPVWFMQVNIWDSVQTYFAGMLNGKRAKDVGAVAACGGVLVNAPVPILVLEPTDIYGVSTMNVNGGGTVAIAGGPSQSIQVNSSDPGAVTLTSNTTIDLTQAGPNFNGADFGVWGNAVNGTPADPPLLCGSGDPWPNCWKAHDPPIADPFAGVPVPAKGTAITIPATPLACPQLNAVCKVPAGTNGCVEVIPSASSTVGDGNGCLKYTGGYYANGINLTHKAAIFDPGVYYIDNAAGVNNPPGLKVDNQSCVRPSTLTGDGSYGTIFYFANGATVNVQNGSKTWCVPANSFPVRSGGLSGLGVFCPGTDMTKIPTPLKTAANITGHVFLGPCTKGSAGTNVYGGDTLFSDATQRGMLFFQSHLATVTSPPGTGCGPNGCQPNLSGGGTYAVSGVLYFHANDYTDLFKLQGGSGSGSFAYGSIVTDRLTVTGGGGIGMYLSPGLTSGVLKTALIQ